MTPAEQKCESVKRLHNKRRSLGICIQASDHGAAFRGGRCKPCWDKKLAAERAAYKPRSRRVK